MCAERERTIVVGCDGEADCCLRLIAVGAQPPDKALTGPGRTWGDSMINGFDWVATAWRLLESIHWHECSLDARGSACEGAECLVRQIIPPVTGFCPP
jgi:hypothetical protein